MKTPPIAALRLPLALVIAASLLAAGGILWSRHQAGEAQQALQAMQTAIDNARRRLVQSRLQQGLVAENLAEYQALAARGFIGSEARLAWIEAVQLANRDAGLYGFDYRLAPRVNERPQLARGLPLGHTAMTLTMPLLVETDLSRFVAALHARAPGLVRVRSCRLSQPGGTPTEAINTPRLQAECELQWFTIAQPGDRS
ncbi:MAG: hypothetical protein AB1593_11640 [Pseudomonadota bacterium]